MLLQGKPEHRFFISCFGAGVENDAFAVPFGKSPYHGSAKGDLSVPLQYGSGIGRKYFAGFVLEGQAGFSGQNLQIENIGIDFKTAAHGCPDDDKKIILTIPETVCAVS